jgi:heptosyltransferase-2
MTARLPAPRRLLVRGVNWLGDAVMATPALARLREALPNTHLTLLTPAKLADLWQHHPALDAVLAVPTERTLFQVARELRDRNFDAGLVLPNSPRSALELWLARIPRRIGGAAPWRNVFLTEVVAPRPRATPMHKRSDREIRRLTSAAPAPLPPAEPKPTDATAHQLHHYLHLAAALGANPAPLAPHLEVVPAELAALRARFDLSSSRSWLGLNPGAEYGPAKRWPRDRFAAVAREVAAWPGWGVVLFGGAGDAALANEIASAIRLPAIAVRNLAGRTSLRELVAALAVCRVVVTNDTGPMHLAAAVGTPVIALFGSTSPELTGPGLPGDPRHRVVRTRVPCAPCFRRVCPIDFRCLNRLEAEAVIPLIRAVGGEAAR